MKLSVSLAEPDLVLLDRFVSDTGLPSRSAGIQYAIRLLDDPETVAAYAEAFAEWADSGDAADWEVSTRDGLDAAR